MGRAPCCSKVGLKRGLWSVNEDTLLTNYIQQHGEGKWRSLPKKAGLLRCGKSCRLRWMNYLRPGIVRGDINQEEEDLIVRLHRLLGNRWSLIAGRLPGRTDNEIKNYWNSHLLKKLNNADIKPNNYLPKQRKIKKSNTKTEKEENKQKNELNAKLNGSSNNTHGQLNMNDPPKIKVYMTKPIRPSAVRTNSLAGVDAAKAQVALSPLFELGGDEDDLQQVSCDQNMLQEVYNEYLQLL